ncbi:MAG TPA: ABC transporter permease [Bryobacteraceae bacterium]|nr:ABC transporter permease [Bryobacteraceae bacterium]
MNSTPRELLARIGSFFRRGQRDADFDRELSSHLQLAIDDNIRAGMSPGEARRAAAARFGSVASAAEEHRDARALPRLDSVLQDVRVAVRGFRRDPGFTLVALLILALGIGANTAVFSVVNTILLRDLPFRDAQRLVWIERRGGTGLSDATFQAVAYEEYAQHSRTFESITGYFAFFAYSTYKWTGHGEPERLGGVDVLPNFVPALGIRLAYGRNFSEEESKANPPTAILISHSLWKRRFGSDPKVIGTKMIVQNRPLNIVGVMPESFDFSSTFVPGTRVDLFLPAVVSGMRNWGNIFSLVGRLNPGISIERANSEFDATVAQVNQRHRDWGAGYSTKLAPLQQHVNGNMRRPLLLLSLAVGAVLLIVCTNLSNLLLARAAFRSREVALRAALGAGRLRILRQLLTESLLLSIFGAALGVGAAYVAIGALAASIHLSVPLLNTVRLDTTALGFTAGIAALTGVLFGLLPAVKLSTANLNDSLKEGARGSAGGQGWLRSSLVIAEIGVACVLVLACGLLIRSLFAVLSVDPGYQPAKIAALRLDPPRNSTREQRFAFFDEAIRLTEAVPGVERAAFTDALPLDRNRTWDLTAEGRVYAPGEDVGAFCNVVSAGFIETMGIPLRSGRTFNRHDTRDSEQVVIINETAARRHWPGVDSVGRIALNGSGRNKWRVVGVVGDVRNRGMEEVSEADFYVPLTQQGPAGVPELIFRTRQSPAALAPGVRAALRKLDPNMPPGDLRTLDALIDRATSPRRFLVTLLSAFAAMSLVLASLGIYGVMSYSVNQRRREFGIRMALGANPGDMRGLVIRRAVALTLAGVGLGTVVAVFSTRLIATLLYGVEPNDARAFAAMLAALIAVALAAAFVPALRASRVQPIEALRAE